MIECTEQEESVPQIINRHKANIKSLEDELKQFKDKRSTVGILYDFLYFLYIREELKTKEYPSTIISTFLETLK